MAPWTPQWIRLVFHMQRRWGWGLITGAYLKHNFNDKVVSKNKLARDSTRALGRDEDLFLFLTFYIQDESDIRRLLEVTWHCTSNCFIILAPISVPACTDFEEICKILGICLFLQLQRFLFDPDLLGIEQGFPPHLYSKYALNKQLALRQPSKENVLKWV